MLKEYAHHLALAAIVLAILIGIWQVYRWKASIEANALAKEEMGKVQADVSHLREQLTPVQSDVVARQSQDRQTALLLDQLQRSQSSLETALATIREQNSKSLTQVPTLSDAELALRLKGLGVTTNLTRPEAEAVVKQNVELTGCQAELGNCNQQKVNLTEQVKANEARVDNLTATIGDLQRADTIKDAMYRESLGAYQDELKLKKGHWYDKALQAVEIGLTGYGIRAATHR